VEHVHNNNNPDFHRMSPVEIAKFCQEVIEEAIEGAQVEHDAECEANGREHEPLPAKKLKEAKAAAIRALAATIGKSGRAVYNYLKILKHTPLVQKKIHLGELTISGAEPLLDFDEVTVKECLEIVEELRRQAFQKAAEVQKEKAIDYMDIRVPGESVFLPPKKSSREQSAPVPDVPGPAIRLPEVEKAIRISRGGHVGKKQHRIAFRKIPDVVALIGDLEATLDDQVYEIEGTDLAIAIAGLLRWVVRARDSIPVLIPVELTGRLAVTPRD